MHSYPMEYYSAIIKKEIFPFVTTWMDHQGIMPSKVRQTEKFTCFVISMISHLDS